MASHDGLTIVVGYDGSESARRGVDRVRGWGLRRSALVLVAVTPTMTSAGLGEELADSSFDSDSVLREARGLLEAGGDAGPVELRTASGDPALVLVRTVREVDADLLVVGRRGRDFVSRALLGSVAERVIRDAPCDVLVVG